MRGSSHKGHNPAAVRVSHFPVDGRITCGDRGRSRAVFGAETDPTVNIDARCLLWVARQYKQSASHIPSPVAQGWSMRVEHIPTFFGLVDAGGVR